MSQKYQIHALTVITGQENTLFVAMPFINKLSKYYERPTLVMLIIDKIPFKTFNYPLKALF